MNRNTFACKIWDNCEAYISTILLALMLVVLSFQIVLRFIFGMATSWSEELSRYWFIALVFISTSLAAKTNDHIKIDFMPTVWPKTIRKYITILGCLVFIGFSVLIAYNGVQYFLQVYVQKQNGPGTQIPLWIVYATIPLGYALMTIRLITRLIDMIRKKDAEAS
jgi:TRAP-type C4-dicarboxylate transport system permease small subunit